MTDQLLHIWRWNIKSSPADLLIGQTPDLYHFWWEIYNNKDKMWTLLIYICSEKKIAPYHKWKSVCKFPLTSHSSSDTGSQWTVSTWCDCCSLRQHCLCLVSTSWLHYLWLNTGSSHLAPNQLLALIPLILAALSPESHPLKTCQLPYIISNWNTTNYTGCVNGRALEYVTESGKCEWGIQMLLSQTIQKSKQICCLKFLITTIVKGLK